MEIEEKKVNGLNIKFALINNIRIGIATGIGPRIIFIAKDKRPTYNLFGLFPNFQIPTQEGIWRIYGGHRLWASPEITPRTYSKDDEPIKIDVNEDTIIIHGNPEIKNSIQKEIKITPFLNDGIQVVHKIKNIGRWPIKFACWAISVMRKNGVAIIPIKSNLSEELLPNRHISIWPYTNLSEKNITFTNEFILIKQDRKIEKPFKIGVMANPPWVAYIINGLLFLKQFTQEDGEYPDFGCSVEVYTNKEILELETLNPIKIVKPLDSIQHTEVWKILEVEDLKPKKDNITDYLGRLINA